MNSQQFHFEKLFFEKFFRYIVVCHPMRAKIICTPSRTRKLILIVSLVCFSLTLPTVFEWKIIDKINANNNQTYVEVDNSELGLNVIYKRIYYWLTVVLFTLMPLIILAVFNIFLIRSVRASTIKRETLTKTSSKRDSSKSSLRPKSKSFFL
jgi:nociceptin receptor